HAIVEAGDRDTSVLVMESSQHVREHADRIGGWTAIESGVQIALCTRTDDLGGSQSAQHERDAWRILVPLRGVADEGVVAPDFVGVLLEEARQAGRARFLLAFEKHCNGNRQLTRDLLPGPRGFEESHELAFIILRAARDDDGAVVWILDKPRLE